MRYTTVTPHCMQGMFPKHSQLERPDHALLITFAEGPL